MALDFCQNFVQIFLSAQYLENYVTEFDQIVCALVLTRSMLVLLPVILANALEGYGP